jgi:uncharacterized protein YjbI with pentapeptide repeats
MQEEAQQGKGPLPRTREGVDCWLKKWGRQAVVDGQEPLTREDVERLIEVNSGTSTGLYLPERNLSAVDLHPKSDSHGHLQPFSLQGSILARCEFQKAMMFSVDLQEGDIAWANFQGACLNGSDLRGANLFNANLSNANMAEAKLQRAELAHTNLASANLA